MSSVASGCARATERERADEIGHVAPVEDRPDVQHAAAARARVRRPPRSAARDAVQESTWTRSGGTPRRSTISRRENSEIVTTARARPPRARGQPRRRMPSRGREPLGMREERQIVHRDDRGVPMERSGVGVGGREERRRAGRAPPTRGEPVCSHQRARPARHARRVANAAAVERESPAARARTGRTRGAARERRAPSRRAGRRVAADARRLARRARARLCRCASPVLDRLLVRVDRRGARVASQLNWRARSGAACDAHARGVAVVVQHPLDGAGERVADRPESTSVPASPSTSGSAPRLAATTGTPTRHRFEDRHAEAFLVRRLDEQPRPLVELAPLVRVDVADVPRDARRAAAARAARASAAAVGRRLPASTSRRHVAPARQRAISYASSSAPTFLRGSSVPKNST